MKLNPVLYVVLFLILFLVFAQLMAKRAFPGKSLPMTSMASGEEMYLVYCASCHGRDGKGASAPALTGLSKKNGGKFPTLLVKETIRGDGRIAAHGPKDMPSWGAVFRYAGSGSRLEVDVRINNLTDYVQSLQEP